MADRVVEPSVLQAARPDAELERKRVQGLGHDRHPELRVERVRLVEEVRRGPRHEPVRRRFRGRGSGRFVAGPRAVALGALRPEDARVTAPKFAIGQIVRHQKFGYRGVVYDVDPEFSLSEEWYEQVARSRPPKDAPWYRVLVHGRPMETYVAERHLESDPEPEPVDHPEVDDHFDEYRGDHYARTRDLH